MTRLLSSPVARRQRGLSLVELMIALVIGLIFSIAILVVQSSLTKQNVQMSDVSQRDDQARAALDLISRDLSNAGFMLGGVQTAGRAVLAYDNAGAMGGVFNQYAVSAVSQTGAPQYPTAAAQPAQGPSSYTTAPTDMLSIYVANNGVALTPPPPSPSVDVMNTVNAPPYTGSTSNGPVANTQLPFPSTAGINGGTVGYLRLILNNAPVYIRVPIVGTANTQSANPINSLGSSLFPGNGYQGFNNALQSAGILPSGGKLSNAYFSLPAARFYFPLQDPANKNRLIVVYYIALSNPGAALGTPGNYPMLMRGEVNALNDQPVTAPTPVAAGVVSLQVLFGVDETNAGAITNYLTWSHVVSNNFTGDVRSVLFGLITKTLHSDPNYTAPNSINIMPATAVLPSSGPVASDKFTPYNVPTAYQNDRFSVLQSEVAVRNQIWPR
jgi:type IV pilus assembly protein PilW